MTKDNKFYNDALNSEDKKSERILHLETEVRGLKRKTVKKRERYKPANTIDYLGSGAGGTTPPSEVASHPLSGTTSPHTGILTDAQAPQFLKTDGSRNLTGSLTVETGITIDGVDLDVLGTTLDDHLVTTSDDHTQYASAEGSDITRSAKHATEATRAIRAIAISLISDTQPASPIPGMVWIDTDDY